MGNNNDVALRKRQQIDSSKRTMFIFVASAAFASGIALVVSFFLVQQIWFHGRVISEKQKTVSTISANLAAVDDLARDFLQAAGESRAGLGHGTQVVRRFFAQPQGSRIRSVGGPQALSSRAAGQL